MLCKFVPVVCALALCACADDLSDPAADANAASTGEHVSHVDNGDGTTTTVVDATGAETWIYLDLESRAEMRPADPAVAPGWDLGFSRFQIKLNGGVSGIGGVAVAALPGADFASLQDAPAQPYATDAADGEDADDDPDLVLSSGDTAWYDYDPMTHTLSPRDVVYVVRSDEGSYFKLRLVGYYDDAGTGGHVQFDWGAVSSPAR